MLNEKTYRRIAEYFDIKIEGEQVNEGQIIREARIAICGLGWVFRPAKITMIWDGKDTGKWIVHIVKEGGRNLHGGIDFEDEALASSIAKFVDQDEGGMNIAIN